MSTKQAPSLVTGLFLEEGRSIPPIIVLLQRTSNKGARQCEAVLLGLSFFQGGGGPRECGTGGGLRACRGGGVTCRTCATGTGDVGVRAVEYVAGHCSDTWRGASNGLEEKSCQRARFPGVVTGGVTRAPRAAEKADDA